MARQHKKNGNKTTTRAEETLTYLTFSYIFPILFSYSLFLIFIYYIPFPPFYSVSWIYIHAGSFRLSAGQTGISFAPILSYVGVLETFVQRANTVLFSIFLLSPLLCTFFFSPVRECMTRSIGVGEDPRQKKGNRFLGRNFLH